MRKCGMIWTCLWLVSLWCGCAESAEAQVRDDEYKDFLSSIQTEFYAFEDSINRDFANYLEQAWQEFTVYEGTEPPVYAAGATCLEAKESAPLPSDGSFFGSSLQFPFPIGGMLSLPDLSEKVVADGWRKLGAEDFSAFFKAYTHYSRQFCLNDWGNFLLLKYATQQRYASLSSHEQTLFLFYLLNLAGYKAKIGRVGTDRLVLLIPFQEEIYKIPFIRVGGRKYYIMDLSSPQLKKLYSIVPDYPKSDRTISLQIPMALDFPVDKVKRDFTGKYPCSLQLNSNLLNFYASFPLCDLSVYFGASLSDGFKRQMDELVKPPLKGKKCSEQMAWLLDFVQQTFTHKPDIEVHKSEVYYFPEETAFYPYADCEDLSVFLSWLVRRYITNNVLILYYPNHVAIAVERYDGYKGEVFTYRDKEYLICDPSYRGSMPGKVIPACASLKPIIVSYAKQID